MADFRGKHKCIFKDTPQYCEWSDKMVLLLDSDGPEDRMDLCRLCQSQDTLRTMSFGFKRLHEVLGAKG